MLVLGEREEIKSSGVVVQKLLRGKAEVADFYNEKGLVNVVTGGSTYAEDIGGKSSGQNVNVV